MSIIGIFLRSFQRGLFIRLNVFLAKMILDVAQDSNPIHLITYVTYMAISTEFGKFTSSILTGLLADIFPASRTLFYGINLVGLCVANGLITYVTSLEYVMLILFARGLFDGSIFILGQTISGTYSAVKILDNNNIDKFYQQIKTAEFVNSSVKKDGEYSQDHVRKIQKKLNHQILSEALE